MRDQRRKTCFMNVAVHEDSTIPPHRAVVSGVATQRDDAPYRSSIQQREFGDYELLDEIARGGMGVVYRAKQVGLNRIVALKMILDAQLASEDDVRRFYSEAQAAASLNHPRIVQVFDVGCVDEQHYFSMEFIEGSSLAALVTRGPLDPQRAAQIMWAVADAVGVAHEQGIVHRDLKPANVILDNKGEPHVTDFGLARRTDRVDPSETGELLGTASYMPPEQAAGDGEHIGSHSDVYALGATLYCLLVGRPPFQAANPSDTLLQVLQRDPVPARQLNAQVPVDLETICAKCLEKSPQRRYPDANLLAADLQRFLNNEPILARPVSMWVEFRKWRQRNPALALVAFALSGAIVALFAVSLMYNARLREERESAQAAERRTVDLLRLSEGLLEELSQQKNAAQQVEFLRATQFGRLIVTAERLAESTVVAEFQSALFAAQDSLEWIDAEKSARSREAMSRLTAVAEQWTTGVRPGSVADALQQVAFACREDWRATSEPMLQAAVERQARTQLAQTIQLILTSRTPTEAEPHLERLQHGHYGTVKAIGLDELAQQVDAFRSQLKRDRSEWLSSEMHRELTRLQALAIVN